MKKQEPYPDLSKNEMLKGYEERIVELEGKLVEQSELYKALFLQSMDGVIFSKFPKPFKWCPKNEEEKRTLIDWTLDNVKVEKVNQALLNQYKVEEKDFIGLTVRELYQHDIELGKLHMEELLDKGRVHLEMKTVTSEGKPLFIEGDFIAISKDNHYVKCFGIQKDITVKKLQQETIIYNEKKYREVLNSVKEVIFQTNVNGDWTFLNTAWTTILGYEVDESIGSPFFQYIHPDDKKEVVEKFKKLHNKETDTCNHEIRYITKCGNVKWMEVFVKYMLNKEGTIKGTAGTLHDITDKVNSQKKIYELAYTDHLTKLPNRISFDNKLESCVRSHQQIAVLFLDIDNFKAYNDTLGHSNGDQLIKKFGLRLQELFKYEVVSRRGGDEFTIFFPYETFHDVKNRAEEILQVLEHPFYINEKEIDITTSIGVSFYPKDGKKVETLLKKADIAMYESKNNGKNQFTFFQQEMIQQTYEKMRIQTELKKALQRKQFQLHLQPKMLLHKEEVKGCEALIRWYHDKMGYVAPNKFIPIAEETGLIHEIGEWVLEEACKLLHSWTIKNISIPISINASMKQFENSNFIQSVEAKLNKYEIDPSFLHIEVTESIMQKGTKNTEYIKRIRDIGAKVAIDDFGTGYSNLAQLINLPLDIIKIDKSFIDNIMNDYKTQSLVEGIVIIGSKLGFTFVAEGIETEEQMKILKKINCQMGQGYYFSKPIPIHDFEKVYLSKTMPLQTGLQ